MNNVLKSAAVAAFATLGVVAVENAALAGGSGTFDHYDSSGQPCDKYGKPCPPPKPTPTPTPTPKPTPTPTPSTPPPGNTTNAPSASSSSSSNPVVTATPTATSTSAGGKADSSSVSGSKSVSGATANGTVNGGDQITKVNAPSSSTSSSTSGPSTSSAAIKDNTLKTGDQKLNNTNNLKTGDVNGTNKLNSKIDSKNVSKNDNTNVAGVNGSGNGGGATVDTSNHSVSNTRVTILPDNVQMHAVNPGDIKFDTNCDNVIIAHNNSQLAVSGSYGWGFVTGGVGRSTTEPVKIVLSPKEQAECWDIRLKQHGLQVEDTERDQAFQFGMELLRAGRVGAGGSVAAAGNTMIQNGLDLRHRYDDLDSPRVVFVPAPAAPAPAAPAANATATATINSGTLSKAHKKTSGKAIKTKPAAKCPTAADYIKSGEIVNVGGVCTPVAKGPK